MDKFFGVLFPKELSRAVVPGSWLQEHELGKGLCRWPNSGDVDELSKQQAKPKKGWSVYHCEVYCSSSKFANMFLLWL